MQREKDHGRTEERRVWVSRHLDLVEETAEWTGLSTLVCVQTQRWQQGRHQQSTRYYFSSLTHARAAQLAGYVRGEALKTIGTGTWMSPSPKMPAAAATAMPRAI